MWAKPTVAARRDFFGRVAETIGSGGASGRAIMLCALEAAQQKRALPLCTFTATSPKGGTSTFRNDVTLSLPGDDVHVIPPAHPARAMARQAREPATDF